MEQHQNVILMAQKCHDSKKVKAMKRKTRVRQHRPSGEVSSPDGWKRRTRAGLSEVCEHSREVETSACRRSARFDRLPPRRVGAAKAKELPEDEEKVILTDAEKAKVEEQAESEAD